jgi:adenylate cyclase
MVQEGFKRKLAAILSTDVVGYSRLMEDDEEATIRSINAYRKSISTLVEQHRGRVVDTTGDNLMAEFSSVVDAVQCAVEIQKEISERNADLPENRRMLFRIGVNLGDIVEEDDKIYGDGVNIAARLESLAEAGGICISRTAYGQVKNKLNLGYEYLGEHSVKNISEPVHVYKVLMDADAAGKVIGEKRQEKRRMTLAAVIALIIGLGGLAGWYLYIEQTKRIAPASVEKMAFPLPDKPSIAVLPFDNLSGDPDQDYFSDGLSEEIITALSKVPRMFVIARNTTFTYKGQAVKVQQVAEELGVRYVLEGSIRKYENKIRITAQLIDATAGHHLWAERYDRDLKDIFALQDEITMKILSELELRLTEGEQALIYRRGTNNLQVYLKFLQAVHYVRNTNPGDNRKARKIIEDIISIEPNYAMAYGLLGETYMMDVWFGTTKSPIDSLRKAASMLEKALYFDKSLGAPYAILGHINVLKREWEKGISLGYQAIELEPNGANSHYHLGMGLNFADRSEEAIPILKKAIRLNPVASGLYVHHIAIAYRMMEQYDKAVEYGEKAVQRSPNYHFAHLNLAACYLLAGREEEARAEAKEVIRLNPGFSLVKFAKTVPLKNQEELKRFIAALRRSGLK